MAQLTLNLLVWQRPEWPYFQWDSSALLDSLVQVRLEQGRLLGLAASLPEPQHMTPIEADLTENFQKRLTLERLHGWQASLFPNGFCGIQKVTCGDYRKKDFVLDSFETIPPAQNISAEMKKFFDWWNESPVGLDGIIRAGIAYFWLMTLQPYEAGNSDLALSILDCALAQDEKIGVRHYDIKKHLSSSEALEMIKACHRSNGDITSWLNWLFEKLKLALLDSQKNAHKQFKIKQFWRLLQDFELNSRQKKILNLFFSKDDPLFFVTNRSCVSVCKQSRESIKRDLQALVKWKILLQSESKGRSYSYFLNPDFFSLPTSLR